MLSLNEITEQKITEKYERLSQDLKYVLSSVNTSTAIENIAVKYRLDEEKITMLIQLVGLVILGFANFEEMEEEMKETIDINLSIIPLIADEIRQKIMATAPQVVKPTIPMLQTSHAPLPTTTPTPIPVTPSVDRYREPVASGPEIIDLRKTPPAPKISLPVNLKDLGEIGAMPISPAPIPPSPVHSFSEGGPRPLTFTKPVEPTRPIPLIEAEPHKITPPQTPASQPSIPKIENQPTAPPRPPAVSPVEPQYIIHPPGLAPTDSPHDILDLRRDKGEF